MRNNAKSDRVVRILSDALGFFLFFASTCFGQNPSFVYVANVNSSNVSGFAIDSSTGSLASIPGSPFTLIDFATGVAISPSNRFLYASADIEIEIFSIDPVTGHLTGQGVPVGQGFGVGPLVFHPSGNFAYSTDNPISGGIGTIFAYSVDKTTGALTGIGSPLATGSQPQMAAITPNGNYLYVANRFSSDISAYAIDSVSGALTPVVGSRFALGILPHGLTVDPTGQFLYVASGESLALAGYNINNTTGALTQITGSPFLGGNRGPTSITVEPTGRFAYAGNSVDGTVSAFSIGANGILVPLPSSPFSTTSLPHSASFSLVVDSLGKFLYVSDFTTSMVYEFQIDPVSGALTQLVSSPISTGGANPVSIAISTGSAPPTTQTITQPLSPTAPNPFNFGTHNFNVQFPPGTSFSGVNMTVAAAQTSQTSFQQSIAGSPFSNATCIVYSGSGGNCVNYQVSCSDTNGNTIPCPSEPTASIDVKTSYDTVQSIINPGFLHRPTGSTQWENIFTEFLAQRVDPTTKGKTKGFSDFVAVDLGASNTQGVGTLQMDTPLRPTDPRVFTQGAEINVRFQLTSIASPGTFITDAQAGLSIVMIADAQGNAISREKLALPPPAFHYSSSRQRYSRELEFEDYPAGTYALTIYGNAFAAQQVLFTVK